MDDDRPKQSVEQNWITGNDTPYSHVLADIIEGCLLVPAFLVAKGGILYLMTSILYKRNWFIQAGYAIENKDLKL